MSCEVQQERVIYDTLAEFEVQLKRGGAAFNLTGKEVSVIGYNDDGDIVIPEDDTNVNISDAANGLVEYDFQNSDYANAAAEFAADNSLARSNLYLFFKVYEIALPGEPDTFPSEDEDGILIQILNPAYTRTTPDPAAITDQAIAELAKSPRRTRTVEGTVEERSVNELIKADQYTTAKAATAVPWGMRVAKTKPPSTLS